MKTHKIMNMILFLSLLLSTTCSKGDTIPDYSQQLIGIWLPDVYFYSFLFSYNQGFELSEDDTYYPLRSPYPSVPIDTTFTIQNEAKGKWFLNESHDSIFFTNDIAGHSISFRIESVSNDSLVLYGKAYIENSEENKEYLFIKKK